MFSPLTRWFRRRQRDTDRQVLFPAVKEVARERSLSLSDIEDVLFWHFVHDWAWNRDYTQTELAVMAAVYARELVASTPHNQAGAK